MEISSLIFIIIIIVGVFFSEFKKKNKEIEKLRKDWIFCKKLLDDTRSVLTEEQKEKIKKIHEEKNKNI